MIFKKRELWKSENFRAEILARFVPDPFLECLLATDKISVSFDLRTENLSKVSETSCFWRQKAFESSKTFRFQKDGFEKHTFRKKEANEKRIGLEEHAQSE